MRMPALEAESALHWSSRTAADALTMSDAGSDGAFGLLGRLRMPAESGGEPRGVAEADVVVDSTKVSAAEMPLLDALLRRQQKLPRLLRLPLLSPLPMLRLPWLLVLPPGLCMLLWLQLVPARWSSGSEALAVVLRLLLETPLWRLRLPLEPSRGTASSLTSPVPAALPRSSSDLLQALAGMGAPIVSGAPREGGCGSDGLQVQLRSERLAAAVRTTDADVSSRTSWPLETLPAAGRVNTPRLAEPAGLRLQLDASAVRPSAVA